jgi:hypothetical protein
MLFSICCQATTHRVDAWRPETPQVGVKHKVVGISPGSIAEDGSARTSQCVNPSVTTLS